MTNPQQTSSMAKKKKKKEERKKRKEKESISCKVRNKTSVPTLTTTIQHSFGVLTIALREQKETKLSLFEDGMIL